MSARGKPYQEQDKEVCTVVCSDLNIRVCRRDRWLPHNNYYCDRIRLIVYRFESYLQYGKKPMKITQFLWIVPFLSFLLGYFLLAQVYPIETVRVPSLVGMTLEKVFPLLSNQNINIRLLAMKQDPELPDGTIVSQNPTAQTPIKPHQAIYVVVSQKPPKMRTPALINKSLSAVEQLLKPHGIRNKMYELPSSSALAGHCIGQFPAPNVPLDEKKVITYCAAEKNTLVLLPKFKQKPVTAVTEFLDGHTIKYTLSPSASSKNHACCEACVVTDQRPLAYSIISVGKQANPVQVHLQVHHAG